MLTKQVGVDGVDMLQIQLPVGPRGDGIPVPVVIIQGNEYRLFAPDPELYRQTVGAGGLARGGGTGQQHSLRLPLQNLVRNLGEAALMKRLVHPDQLAQASLLHQVIEIRHRRAAHEVAPALALCKYCGKVGQLPVLANPVRITRIREAELHPRPPVRHQVPYGEVACGGSHLPIKIVHIIPIGIHVKIWCLAPGQEPGLVYLPPSCKGSHGLLGGDPLPQQGNVHFYQLGDPLL